MTGVRWVRLEAGFPTNPKMLTLFTANRHRAVAVYMCGLAYSGSQGTDGWIPRAALPFLHARPTDAHHLETAGLWEPHDGGWVIHDWHDYQPTNDTIAARTHRARAAAQARWGNAGRNA